MSSTCASSGFGHCDPSAYLDIWSQNNTEINSRQSLPEVHHQPSLWWIFILSQNERKKMWTIVLQKSSIVASEGEIDQIS